MPIQQSKVALKIHDCIDWISSISREDLASHWGIQCQSDTTYCYCHRCFTVGELFRAWRAELGPIEFPASKTSQQPGSVR